MRRLATHPYIASICLVVAACGSKDVGGPAVSGLGTLDHDTTAHETAGGTASSAPVTTSDGESAAGATTGATEGATGSPTTGSSTGETPGALVCPESIDQAILACVADLQGDAELAEGHFLLDLLFMCADAEPVADDYDAHCALAPADPICGLEYVEFVEGVLPACIDRVQSMLFADRCLLPASYDDLLFAPGIALMDRRLVKGAADLAPIEQQQLLMASADMGFPAETVAAALLATDEKSVELLTVLDVGTDRALVFYSAHYGDTRVGRVFFWKSLTMVGAIEDGFFSRCGVERAIEGQPCTDDVACAPEHMCLDILESQGRVLAPGTCVWPAPLVGEGVSCSAHDDCDPSSGLLCIDILAGGDSGTCRPGWMRRSFAGPDTALVAGGTVMIPLVISGVATVPTAAYLDLQLTQNSANELAVHLVNPDGTSALVSAIDAPLWIIDLEQVGVPGDESAGGIWHLVVEDIGGDASGAATRVALTLDTRWD
jgi:hypothetical protein